jgi:hypothetical protein
MAKAAAAVVDSTVVARVAAVAEVAAASRRTPAHAVATNY